MPVVMAEPVPEDGSLTVPDVNLAPVILSSSRSRVFPRFSAETVPVTLMLPELFVNTNSGASGQVSVIAVTELQLVSVFVGVILLWFTE